MRNRIRGVDDLLRDLRFGLRQLSRSPGFAATAILTLALGLGANTAVFSLINGLLLRPLPVAHAEQLSILESTISNWPEPNDGFSAPMARALEKRAGNGKDAAFQDVAAFWISRLQVRGASGNIEVSGAVVSGQFFRTLQTPAALGRYLTTEDDRTGNPGGFPVVISDGFWQRWFNRSANVVGSKLVVANTPFTVVGVMPRSFIGAVPSRRPEIYLPLSTEPIVDAPYDNTAAGANAIWLQMIARRNPGISQEQAQAGLQSISDAILVESNVDADQVKMERQLHFQLASEHGAQGSSYLRTQFKKPLLVVFALCAAMLLLACLNLASLLMARAAARERELSTRLALGASRRRLMQQLLVESLLISGIGTVAGLAVTPLVSRFLSALLLSSDPQGFLDTSLDLPVFAFAAAITVLASIVTGLIPALRATSGDLNEHIKSGSHTHSTRERRLLPRVLMGSEVALALTLVIGAGLLAASLTRLYQIGLGFEPKGLVNLKLEMAKQPLEEQALVNWYQQFGEALSRQPGVEGVSFERFAPLSGAMWLGGMETPFSKGRQDVSMNSVGPGYFRTMHIPLMEGREFRWQDTKTSGKKVIMNQAAARVLFPNQDAVGKTLTDWDKTPLEVVAVVGNVTYTSIRKAAPPTVYTALTQELEKKDSYVAVVRLDKKLAGSAAPFATAVHALAAQMAPDIPAPVMTTMSSTLDASISTERMMAMLSSFFAACALLVTGIGLYGTLAYTTARRTSEIGIRIALGSKRLQVVLLVFRENLWSTALGCLAGLGIALVASKALSSFLYGTSTRDPWVMVASVVALALIASAASLLPAVKAARTDPMRALRTE